MLTLKTWQNFHKRSKANVNFPKIPKTHKIAKNRSKRSQLFPAATKPQDLSRSCCGRRWGGGTAVAGAAAAAADAAATEFLFVI